MGMGGQKQYDVFITVRKKAKCAEHQRCSPDCCWHQFLRHGVSNCLGWYWLFWQPEPWRKGEKKIKWIIGVRKQDNLRVWFCSSHHLTVNSNDFNRIIDVLQEIFGVHCYWLLLNVCISTYIYTCIVYSQIKMSKCMGLPNYIEQDISVQLSWNYNCKQQCSPSV